MSRLRRCLGGGGRARQRKRQTPGPRAAHAGVPEGQHVEASGAAAVGAEAQGQRRRPVPGFSCIEES